MAEFKKLSAVEAVEAVSDAANVLIEENGIIKRAPKGEVGGIKVASTAEVGQTIVVKAVDAAGNPTEWECADMTSGGISYDAIIAVTGDPYMCCDFAECNISADTTEILSVVEKLQNNENVNVAIKYYYTYGTNEYYSFTPASVRCRAEGTINTGDNQLNIGCLMTNHYTDWYAINISFSTTDGSYISSTYKTITMS